MAKTVGSLVVAAALVVGILIAAPIAPRPSAGARATAQTSSAAVELGWFSKNRAMFHVRKLANAIGVRERGTRGERRAAAYVAKKLRQFGYRTKLQRFAVGGRRSRNVVGWWPGTGRSGLVVGGHIDTVAGSPGANDNASGIAVMLELARLTAGKRPARFIRWVGFGSEEFGANNRHHVGSRAYVNRLGAKGRRRLGGMVSIDMVADGWPLIVATAGIGPTVVADSVNYHAKKAVRAVRRTTCDCSDNGPFERAGIPAGFVWSGSERDHHEPSDTPANLKPKHLLRTGRGLRAFVRAVDVGMIRRFRRS